MQRPPLPVDVTSTWWDYVVDVADILAGLGAAGALLIAALAYRRQVDEAVRRQAAAVVLQIVSDQEREGQTEIYVHNGSDQEITILDYAGIGMFGDNLEMLSKPFIRTMAAHGSMRIAHAARMSEETHISFTFRDAGGGVWTRSNDGSLQRLPKLLYRPVMQWLRERAQKKREHELMPPPHL